MMFQLAKTIKSLVEVGRIIQIAVWATQARKSDWTFVARRHRTSLLLQELRVVSWPEVHRFKVHF